MRLCPRALSVTAQERDADQRALTIAFAMRPTMPSRGWLLGGVGAGLMLIAGALTRAKRVTR